MNRTEMTMATYNLQNNDNIQSLCKNLAVTDCQNNYEVNGIANLSGSINNQPNMVVNNDDYDILAIDRLSHSLDIVNPQADNDNKNEEPADNTLNEDPDQRRSDYVINKKRLVSFILGIICFFTGTGIMFVSLWYTQLRSGIGNPNEQHRISCYWHRPNHYGSH